MHNLVPSVAGSDSLESHEAQIKVWEVGVFVDAAIMTQLDVVEESHAEESVHKKHDQVDNDDLDEAHEVGHKVFDHFDNLMQRLEHS